MSDPNVARKKSYRWVSASKVSYDGLGWNSSEENLDDNYTYYGDDNMDDGRFGGNEINGHFDKLPALPKLNYSDKDSLHESFEENIENQQYNDGTKDSGSSRRSSTQSKNKDNVLKSDFNESNSDKGNSIISNLNNMSSSTNNDGGGNDNNNNNNKRSGSNDSSITTVRNSITNLPFKKNFTATSSRDINEDLDNLMEQISKEMTPQLPKDNNEVFQQEYVIATNNDSNSNMESFVSARESQSANVSKNGLTIDKENKIPQSGYLKQYLDSNSAISNNKNDDDDDNNDNDNSDTSSNGEENALSYTDSIKYQSDNNCNSVEEEKKEEREEEVEEEEEGDYYNILSDEDFKFDNEKSRESILEFSDGEDGNNVDYNQISNDNISEQVYGMKEDNNGHAENIVTKSSDETSSLEVPKSGYFSKVIGSEQQNLISNNDNKEEKEEVCVEVFNKNDLTEDVDDNKQKDEEGESLSISETTNDEATINTNNMNEIETNNDEIMDKRSENLVFVDDHGDDDKISRKKDDNNDDNDEKSVFSFKHETFVTMNKGSEEKREDQDNLSEDNDDVKTTESWKPDTESLRSGFVQETAKTLVAPPGFVFDENGELVDLTPSSMKPRVVSTYSEIESGWNVFPTNYNSANGSDAAELETIHDTKTLYDNSTIYNVPGLLTNSQNFPPLPNNINSEMSEEITNKDTNITLNHELKSNNVLGNTSTKTTTSDVVNRSIDADNVQGLKNTPRINLNNVMPELNINQIILSKTSHSAKIQQLNDYYDALFSYDTGLRLWVQHSLNMPRQESEAIMDYKQSKIVREAYANAEELSKKHTVSNTMASVNQNVNHLKKKVLQHTMKPKTLFSSIGKGVKL